MKIKKIISTVILGGVLTLCLLVLQASMEDSGNPYIRWSLNSVYSISEARVTHTILPNGDLQVYEEITYDMRKPFRLLYRDLPAGRYVQITDFEIWSEGIDAQHIEYLRRSASRVEAEVWLVPFNSGQRLNPHTHPTVTLHVRYTMRNTLEQGTDIAQFFPLFWGRGWDAPVSNLQYSLTYPESFGLRDVYAHPQVRVHHETISGQPIERIALEIDRLPPFAYGEVRAVFDSLPEDLVDRAVVNPGLSWKAIQDEESEYARLLWIKRIAPWLLLLGYWLLIILIYRKMGKAPRIAYEAIYERELPTKDPPATINLIVKNKVGNLDQDGIGATIMNLYRLGAIDLSGEDNPVIRVLDKDISDKLSPGEEQFLSLLKEFSQDNVFDFNALKKQLKKSVSKAKQFSSKMRSFEHKVRSEALSRKYFRIKGNVLSKFLGVLVMILALFTPALMIMRATPDLLDMGIIFSYFFWGSGLIVLLMPKTVFGQWTPEGLEYYRKWKNFEAFLTDFSSLSEHPPESVILWEEYLVYASALGIAEQVRKSLKKMIPQDVWQEQSNHPYFYTVGTAFYASQFSSVRSVASSTAHASQSSSGGGFSGGAGGAGGGFGGGGGGAR